MFVGTDDTPELTSHYNIIMSSLFDVNLCVLASTFFAEFLFKPLFVITFQPDPE